MVAAAATVVEAQTATSTGTKSRAIRQIREMLDDEHGPGVVPMPSRATCYRLLEALSAGKYTFGAATTRRQATNKPAQPYAVTTANRPGEQVQMDSTPLDVMAVMDDGVIGRAELVLAIDIATRTICAGVLRPVGAKAVDAALLLARVTVPELMRPGWDAALAMSASRIPHQRLISLDTRMALAAAKPVIVPDTVVIDHGKVFLSEVFLRAANTLGISVQPAHQQTPSRTSRRCWSVRSFRSRCSIRSPMIWRRVDEPALHRRSASSGHQAGLGLVRRADQPGAAPPAAGRGLEAAYAVRA
ncbi:hypothetical protein [Salinispora arenicola]|uniref:hypothetical protein n=2 Tax=Salinispora arenicola TaxID=168697 RepID=UPI0027DDE2DA|nr:hypothetical protein [Salinispora arenicola]